MILAESTKKPIWICSSGGIDSEIVCEIFLELNIPFSVLTLEYAHDKNTHDISYAKKWCKENGIHQKIYPLSLEEFVDGELESYIKKGYMGKGFFRYIQIKLLSIVEDMGGFAILGGGEQLYEIDVSKENSRVTDPYMLMDIGFLTPLAWCRKNNTEHEPFFYFSTPEIMYSWLKIPIVDFALKNPDIFRHPANKHSLKALAMRYHFPHQQARNKYTGYEGVSELEKKIWEKVKAEFVTKIDSSRMQMHLHTSELLRQLQP